jgi:DNA-binding beta-propeller fold protein YncE
MQFSRSLAVLTAIGFTSVAASAATIHHVGAPMVRNHMKLDAQVVAPQFRHAARSPFHLIPPMSPDKKAKAQLVFDGDSGADSGLGAVLSAAITSPPSGSLATYFSSGTEEVQGVANAGKTLYVANTGDSNVLVLDKTGSLKTTLSDAGEYPVNVALGKKKVVYVANIFNTSFGAGNVSVYAKGATSPTSTLSAPSFFQLIGIAVDGGGDVFVSNDTGDFTGGQVVEFPAGSSTGTVLTNIHLSIAGGLAVDPSGNLAVVDQGTTSVSIYAPPYTGSSTGTYPVPNGGSSVGVAFDKAGANLYFADVFGTIDVDSYPGGTYEGSYTGGVEPIGVAVRPSPKLKK